RHAGCRLALGLSSNRYFRERLALPSINTASHPPPHRAFARTLGHRLHFLKPRACCQERPAPAPPVSTPPARNGSGIRQLNRKVGGHAQERSGDGGEHQFPAAP